MNTCLVCSTPTKYQYCSLSCSNIGRTTKNEAKYNLNPKKCKQCEGAIPYLKRHFNIFCSSSCAATYSNTRRELKLKPKPKKEDRSHHTQMMKRFFEGKQTNRQTLYKALVETKGNHCHNPLCTVQSTWCNNSITLTVDHIDGNAGNNHPSNLRLLCPNCNSQTSTFGGRNKGHGRQARGLSRYA